MKGIVNKIISVLIKHSDYKNYSTEQQQVPEKIIVIEEIYLRCEEGDNMFLKQGEIYKVKKSSFVEAMDTLFYEVSSSTKDLPGFYDEKRFAKDVTPLEKKKFELTVFANSFSKTSF